MPSGGTLRVEGLDNLVRTMRRAGIELEDLKRANAAVSQMVAQWAGVRAPRRSGRLGASIRGTRQARAAVVSSTLVYAGVIHYGWPRRGIRAQPFVLNAAQETEPAWSAEYERDLERILATVKGA